MRSIYFALTSILAGMMLYMSFPPYGLSFLVWIALVLVLIATERGNTAFFLAWLITGMAFFLSLFDWIRAVPGYTWLHHAILAVYLGAYFGIFGLAFGFISRRGGPALALFAAPFVWVCLEYIRSHFFFLALPWGLLAHSQYRHPLILQVAALAGSGAVGFLVVAVNAALAALVLLCAGRFHLRLPGAAGNPSRPALAAVVAAAAALLAAALIYGQANLSAPPGGQPVTLALVQANIAQEKKWDPRYAREIIAAHVELTKTAAASRPDLIVWPEAATPRPINRDPALYGEIRRLASGAGAPLLLGSSQAVKFRQAPPGPGAKLKNSAFLFSPGAGSAKPQRYDKMRLMPFGEYLPCKGVIPWSLIGARAIDSYLPGEAPVLFELAGARFAVTICWENLFAGLVRRSVADGAQFVVNITNEAWFGETAAPYQFLSMSVLRAVENRVHVVRCANTGISCFIDPCGRILDRVKNEAGRDIFVSGVLTHALVPRSGTTLYTRAGEWFAGVCLVSALVFLAAAARKKPRLRKASGRPAEE